MISYLEREELLKRDRLIDGVHHGPHGAKLKRPGTNWRTFRAQVGLTLVWIVVLFLVDYGFKSEFRQTQWAVICYVVLYPAGMGG
jgi:hypothetical protein